MQTKQWRFRIFGSKRFLSSAASVLASTVCIVSLILGGTVARAQEGSMLGAGEIVVLAQTRETSPTRKDPMSWKGNRIAELSPQLVTFNGSGFDLPVLRYRAMVHAIPAVGLTCRPYFHRYSDDAIDLCDVLSSYSSQAKVGLHELCKVMGLPGKPNGISGADVEKYYLEGRIREIADYCESDVLNTFRVWLRYAVQ
jgi:Predicted 3'-5' exonuclease related to the exonuclease domain of PolB